LELLISRNKFGIAVDELRDAYLGVEDDLRALIAERRIIHLAEVTAREEREARNAMLALEGQPQKGRGRKRKGPDGADGKQAGQQELTGYVYPRDFAPDVANVSPADQDIRELWERITVPASDTVVEDYLRAKGLLADDETAVSQVRLQTRATRIQKQRKKPERRPVFRGTLTNAHLLGKEGFEFADQLVGQHQLRVKAEDRAAKEL